jgi:Holliday junction resolvase RusA-like endonuclease
MLQPTAVDTSDRPFGLGLIEFAIDLPFPPSVNRTRRIHGKGARQLKAWHKRADVLLIAARGRTRQPLPFRKIKGPFEAAVIMSEHHGKIDLDNGIKAILDYAVRIELIPDDGQKYMRRLVVEWGAAIEGCRLTLREIA